MLAIRMQRTGRSGHSQFRLIVQESHRSPKSGSIVAALGNYDPHAKTINVDKEKAVFYLNNGAQPSSRVAVLLKNEGLKLPSWVKIDTSKGGAVRNPDKRRSTRPASETTEHEAAASAEPEASSEAQSAESMPAEAVEEAVPSAEKPTTEAANDTKDA